MRVKVRQLGAINRPSEGLSRWFYHYFLEAENGLVTEEYDEDLIEEGMYDMPDDKWRITEDEDDLLGSTTSRSIGPRTFRQVCEDVARCWA